MIKDQSKDKPVLYGCKFNNGNRIDTFNSKSRAENYVEGALKNGADVSLIALYTTSTQSKLLTLEQLRQHWQNAKVFDMTGSEIDFADYVLIVRDIEALLFINEKI
jgi:hypothetical protein